MQHNSKDDNINKQFHKFARYDKEWQLQKENNLAKPKENIKLMKPQLIVFITEVTQNKLQNQNPWNWKATEPMKLKINSAKRIKLKTKYVEQTWEKLL